MRAALVDINHLRRQRRGKGGAEIEIGGGCMQASRTSLEGDLHIKVAQILKVMAAYMHVSLVNQRERETFATKCARFEVISQTQKKWTQFQFCIC